MYLIYLQSQGMLLRHFVLFCDVLKSSQIKLEDIESQILNNIKALPSAGKTVIIKKRTHHCHIISYKSNNLNRI